MKILILGSNGKLGGELMKSFSEYNPKGWDKEKLDITDFKKTREKINALAPELVVNAAAYTDVDGCEKNEARAMEINGLAVGNIAQAVFETGAMLVHFSTDYVFEGAKKEGYEEKDRVGPINTYGRSKALGEALLKQNLNRFYLIRTSWLFGGNGNDFVKRMLELGNKKDELEVVEDQHGKPTYAPDLAEEAVNIIEMGRAFGIYHCINENSTSWFDYSREIFDCYESMNSEFEKPRLKPVSSKELARPASRPKWSILKNTKLEEMRAYDQALEEYLKTRQ